MRMWHFIAGAIVLWLIFGNESGSKHSTPAGGSHGSYRSPYTPPLGSHRNQGVAVGEFDCTVFNITTGNGPYTLMCDRDGDEITINFPNGGYIIVDEDGYHARTGHFWEVEID